MTRTARFREADLTRAIRQGSGGMKRVFAGMTFDEITSARKALFATGGMVLAGAQMEMVAVQPEHQPLAALYNRLAAVHGVAARDALP